MVNSTSGCRIRNGRRQRRDEGVVRWKNFGGRGGRRVMESRSGVVDLVDKGIVPWMKGNMEDC